MKKILCLLALLIFASPAHSTVIFDTGQPDYLSQGWLLNTNQWLAAEFDVDSAYTVTDIQGFMFVNYGGILDITLYEGTDRIFSTSMEVSPTYGWTGASNLDWTIQLGTYWIAFETEDTGFEAGMPWGAPNSTGDEFYTYNGKYYNPEDWGYDRLNLGVKIEGDEVNLSQSSVPEPATMLLLGSGMFVLGMFGRSKRLFKN